MTQKELDKVYGLYIRFKDNNRRIRITRKTYDLYLALTGDELDALDQRLFEIDYPVQFYFALPERMIAAAGRNGWPIPE